MTVGERLHALAKAAGYEHLSEFAEAAGVKPGTAQQQANRNSIPWGSAQKYIARARATGASIEWLLAGNGPPPRQIERVAEEVRASATEALPAPDAPLPPMRTEMPKDVPVYGTVVGGTGQGNLFDFELNGTIVDYARRPPRIAGRADVFAAYVSGGSMAPWREPGQLIYVEAVKPPRAMDYVLVEMKPHDGHSVRPALVKRLLAITPTKVRLRQFDPPKDFEIDRRTVLRVLRVMDWDELMGV